MCPAVSGRPWRHTLIPDGSKGQGATQQGGQLELRGLPLGRGHRAGSDELAMRFRGLRHTRSILTFSSGSVLANTNQASGYMMRPSTIRSSQGGRASGVSSPQGHRSAQMVLKSTRGPEGCCRRCASVLPRASASDKPTSETNGVSNLNQLNEAVVNAAAQLPPIPQAALVATNAGGWGMTASTDDDESSAKHAPSSSQGPANALTALQALQNPPEKGGMGWERP